MSNETMSTYHGHNETPTNKHIMHPYGDTTNNNMIQLSFTLPVPHNKQTKNTTLQLTTKINLKPTIIIHTKTIKPSFTFFIIYNSIHHLINLSTIKIIKHKYPLLSTKKINNTIKSHLHHPLIIINTYINTDTHTININTILNIKNFTKKKNLKYYSKIQIINLNTQILIPNLIKQTQTKKTNTILISQIITQQDTHLHNTTKISTTFHKTYPTNRHPLLIIKNPHFNKHTTEKLNIDHIFNKNTTPNKITSYLIHTLLPPTNPLHKKKST